MLMDELVLNARAITKSYGAVQALRELSVQARAGDVIGLLGPNGAGKTTAIRVLTTILPPTGGEFTINGIPHTRPAEIRRQIGVLPESAGYPDQQTGHEYLTYYARLYGQSAQRARATAAALLTELGLGSKATTRIAAYSRGMRQRLGVARALVNDPLLIVLDEPTLGLDPAGQRQMMRLIRDLAQQRGATVMLSTHLLDEAEGVCSRIIILNHGQVVAHGSVAEVKRQAGAQRTGWFRVAPELQDVAVGAVSDAEGVARAWVDDTVRGRVAASFDAGWLNRNAEAGMNTAIRALLVANVPILAFEPEGDSLNDAFLALTDAGQP